MSEAFIVRRCITEEIQSGTAMLLLSLKYSTGEAASNISVSCDDGGTFYNYTTNSNGQILYPSINSGLANLNIRPIYSNGIMIADQISDGWYNVEVPYKKITKLDVSFKQGSNIVNGNYVFINSTNVSLDIAGGQGGKGGEYTNYDAGYSWDGGCGGKAESKYIKNIAILKNKIYQAIVGKAGNIGSRGYYYSSASYSPAGYGSSGGTSSFLGYSATGGGGGGPASSGSNGSFGRNYGNWGSNYEYYSMLDGYIRLS